MSKESPKGSWRGEHEIFLNITTRETYQTVTAFFENSEVFFHQVHQLHGCKIARVTGLKWNQTRSIYEVYFRIFFDAHHLKSKICNRGSGPPLGGPRRAQARFAPFHSLWNETLFLLLKYAARQKKLLKYSSKIERVWFHFKPVTHAILQRWNVATSHLQNCVHHWFEMKSNALNFWRLIQELFLARTIFQKQKQNFISIHAEREGAKRAPLWGPALSYSPWKEGLFLLLKYVRLILSVTWH